MTTSTKANDQRRSPAMSAKVKEQDGASLLRLAILAYQEAWFIAEQGSKAAAVLMRSQMFLRTHWKNIQTLAKMRRS